MPTFICTLPDAQRARQFAGSLLEDGVAPDDISIVLHERAAQDQFAVLTDATDVLGTRDEARELVSALAEVPVDLPEDRFQESGISAGIATSTPDDAISTIDESDDSQARAEDESEAHVTQGVHEETDLQRALITGFPTDVPKIDDFADLPGYAAGLESGLGVLNVEGLGEVLGQGELATAALSVKPGDGLRPLRQFLAEYGMEGPRAADLLDAFAGGAALVAVSLSGGLNQANRMEAAADRLGARIAETIGAPNY